MTEWLDIESAPRNGSLVLCCRAGDEEVGLLCWKTNRRITEAKESTHPESVAYWADYSDTYFGDPVESDDYDLAKHGAGPTHWMPYPPIPTQEDDQ